MSKRSLVLAGGLALFSYTPEVMSKLGPTEGAFEHGLYN